MPNTEPKMSWNLEMAKSRIIFSELTNFKSGRRANGSWTLYNTFR